MGYYMFAYGVKTPEIKAVFGSKDEALLQKVKGIRLRTNLLIC